MVTKYKIRYGVYGFDANVNLDSKLSSHYNHCYIVVLKTQMSTVFQWAGKGAENFNPHDFDMQNRLFSLIVDFISSVNYTGEMKQHFILGLSRGKEQLSWGGKLHHN